MSFPGHNTDTNRFSRNDTDGSRFRPVSPLDQYGSQTTAQHTPLPSLCALVPDRSAPPQQIPPLKGPKPPLPVDLYPTPPPSPDLIELQVVPAQPNSSAPAVPPVANNNGRVGVVETESDRCYSDLAQSARIGDNYEPTIALYKFSRPPVRQTSPDPPAPAIPISLLLNDIKPTAAPPTVVPHSFPSHPTAGAAAAAAAAPLKLAQPAGILSVLGGNRVLRIDGTTSVLDRMPYSAASTNGHPKGKGRAYGSLTLTQDQGEEASVEAMLNGEEEQVDGDAASNTKSHPTLAPMSPDQTRVSTIFVQPPTPDREEIEANGTHSPSQYPLSARSGSDPGSRTASPRAAPSSSAAPLLPLGLQTLPEVRSPPRKTLDMSPEPSRISSGRGRSRRSRPKMFGFTEMGDGDGGSSSASSSRNNSPEREFTPAVATPGPSAAVVAQTQEAPASSSSSMGPASSAPGNFIPRRQNYTRAKSDTNLHESRHSTSSSPSSSSYLAPSKPKPQPQPQPQSQPQSMLAPPDRHASGQITMTSRRNTGLKLDFTGIVPLTSTGSSGPQTAGAPSPYSAKLIRKKSGEILKPALKYGGPLAANGTPLEAPPKPGAEVTRARFASKSLPATPSSPRFVHFDAQLTRVKLYETGEKPSAVSRSGSPSGEYTTSEGEEYPFPSTDDEAIDKREKKVLQIQLPNFPVSHEPGADLFLESLFLDDDRKSLRGVVQVRNMAFQKWVAIRFTFDWWQTTSEVTATHKDSVKGGEYDRFTFTVKLHDLLAKIEEKTLFLAIRYNTDGKEIWDSNGGHNYQVLFEKVYASGSKLVPKRQQPTIQPGMGKAIGGRTSQWSVTSGHDDDRLADLRAKLNRLSADDPCLSPPQVSPSSSRHNSFSPQRRNVTLDPITGSPRRSVSAFDARNNNSGDLPAAGGGLAARYDFGVAFKKERRSSNSPPTGSANLPDVRTGLLQYGQNGLPIKQQGQQQQQETQRGRPTMDFYSPRSEYAKLSPTEGFFAPMQQQQQQQQTPARRGSASPPVSASSSSSTVTVTPPSYIPVPDLKVQGPSPEPSPNADEAPSQSSSTTVSPPQLDPSTGSVTDDTPSESPKSPPEATMSRWSPTEAKKELENGMTSYASFIEQFCWAGNAPPSAVTSHLERPSFERRAHSTSSLDNYFHSHGAESSPSAHHLGSGHVTPKGGSRPGSGGYFTASSDTTSVSGYYSSLSTPSRTHSETDMTAVAAAAAAAAVPGGEGSTSSGTSTPNNSSTNANTIGGGLELDLGGAAKSPPVIC